MDDKTEVQDVIEEAAGDSTEEVNEQPKRSKKRIIGIVSALALILFTVGGVAIADGQGSTEVGRFPAIKGIKLDMPEPKEAHEADEPGTDSKAGTEEAPEPAEVAPESGSGCSTSSNTDNRGANGNSSNNNTGENSGSGGSAPALSNSHSHNWVENTTTVYVVDQPAVPATPEQGYWQAYWTVNGAEYYDEVSAAHAAAAAKTGAVFEKRYIVTQAATPGSAEIGHNETRGAGTYYCTGCSAVR